MTHSSGRSRHISESLEESPKPQKKSKSKERSVSASPEPRKKSKSKSRERSLSESPEPRKESKSRRDRYSAPVPQNYSSRYSSLVPQKFSNRRHSAPESQKIYVIENSPESPEPQEKSKRKNRDRSVSESPEPQEKPKRKSRDRSISESPEPQEKSKRKRERSRHRRSTPELPNYSSHRCSDSESLDSRNQKFFLDLGPLKDNYQDKKPVAKRKSTYIEVGKF
jgi:hypothetical protein